MFNTYEYGGYLIWRLWSQQKVFIDDRYDMYPTSLIYDYFDLTSAKPGWSKVLDRYGIEVIVWGKDSALASLLDSSDGWQRVHTAGTDGIWVRA